MLFANPLRGLWGVCVAVFGIKKETARRETLEAHGRLRLWDYFLSL